MKPAKAFLLSLIVVAVYLLHRDFWNWRRAEPLAPEDRFSITYYAPQPCAVLRVVNPQQPSQPVGYGEWVVLNSRP